MADKEVLLETTQNGNDEQLAITRPVDYIEQYRNAHKDLVMTGDDMARNYTYDPATWTPSQPKESRGRAIAMGLTDFATDIVETPQQVSQWATGGIVGLKKTFFPNMDETEFERTYRNVQRKMNKAAEARAEEIAKTGYPETYEWTNAIGTLATYIGTGGLGAAAGAARATSKAAAKSIAKGLGVTARQAKNIAKGAKKGAEVAVGTLAGVQTTGQLSQEFAQQYASDTGDVELKNYNPSKDASLSALLGVVSGFVNSKLDVSRYAGRFNSEKSITKALEQGLRGATEEFVEESIESITQDIGRIASGYQYDLSLDDVLTNALTNGIMGAVLGGVAGAGLYSINRARMVKWYTDKGLTEDTAKKVTDQMLTEGRSQILDQINTNYELATKNGEAYTKVKDIYQKLLENVGSKNSVELADTYARMTADWLTMHADQYGLPTSLFIDANEAMDNMVALRQFTSQDVKDRITELKTTLVHQKNIGEASNPDIVADAKRKLRVLQKVDTINTNKENARMKALDLKIAKTQGLYDKIESAWNKPSAMGTTEEKLAYLSNGNKNTFKKTMVYAPAKVKNGLAQVADKVNEPIRASIANALGKLDSVNKENFIDSVSNSISNTDSTLDNTMLYMMLFEDQATLSNFTSLYADKTEKDVNLSSKDAIGQSLKEIDELKQISNPNYQSKFGSNGEMLDPNMLAAFMSYQNQYQTLNQTTYTEETININGVEKTVYNSKGERIANTELELRSFYNWFGDSKVVDKQGRPLVVYHGARGKSDITEFIPQEYGYNVEATYFATNKSAAGHWAETSYTKRNINPDEYMKRVYETDSVKELLDMYNSFGAKTEIVEYDGFYRLNEHDGMLSSPLGKKITESTFEVNGRTIDLVKELQRKISSIVYDSVNSDLYSVYAKLDNPLVVDAKKNPYWKIEYDGTTTNTETIATKAKAQGYDGVIIKNVLETDYENVLTDDVMVFDSTQIKSTDNRGTYDSRTPNIYYQIGYASLRGELVGDSLDAERFEGTGEDNSVWAWGNYLLKSQALDKKYYYDTFNSDSNTRVLYNEEPLSDIFKNELVRNTITSGIKHGLPYYKLVKNLEESYESSGRTRLTIGKESIINTIKNPNDYESSTKMYNINADIIKNNPKEDSLKLLDKIYEMAEYGTSTVKGSEISAKYQDNEVFKALRQLVTNEYGGLDNLNRLINNIKTMREDIDKFKSLDFEKFSGWLGYRYDGKPIETDVSIIIDKNTPVLIDSRSDMILVRSKTLNEAIKKLTDIHTKESQRINSELSDMEQDAENYSFKGIFKIWKESALLGTNTRITENIKAYDDFIKANELQFGSKSKNKEDLLKLYQAFPEIKLITELIDDNIRLQHDIDYLKTLDPTKFEHKQNASMYEFDVPEDKYLLDFKKPLNKQSVYIQKALAKLYEETKLGLDPVKTIFKTSNLLPINLKAEDILPNPLSEDDIIATYEDVLKGFVFTWNNSGLDVAKNDLKSSIDNMEKNLRDGEVYFINNFTDYLNVKKFVKTITDKIPEDAQISDYFIKTTSMDSEINGERLYTSIEKDIDLPQYRYTLAKDLGALDKEGYTRPQKATSKLLERYGVKGVKYNGKRDKQGFVTFGKTPMIRQLYQLQTSESNKDVAYTNKSADVINMLGNLRNPVRFMFDETNKQWIIGKGDSLVHDSMWRQAYKDGMLDFKSESDAIDYFNLSRYEDKNIHSFVALPYSNNDFMTPMHEFGDDYQYMYVVPTNNTDGFIVLSRQPNGKDLLNSGLDKVYNSGTLYNISSEYKPELVKESTSQYTWDSESPALFQRNAIGGWYDPELATIALGRNFNELTLAHELAHHWLTQYFNLYKQYKNSSLKATDAWAEDAERLFSLIGIDPNQDSVTREQQEKWATMNEAYLTGFVPEELKNNISYRDFQRWIPEKYKSILQIGYLDQDNNVINPILSESDIEFFNKWYAHPDFTSLHVQPEAQKWAEKATSTKVMNDREKTIAQDWEEQESGIKTMDRIRNDNIPTDLKAAVDAEEVRIHNKDSQEIPNLPEHKSFSLFGAKNAQERMADIARNYVQKNIEHAKEIAMANPLFVENDTGVDREFLILAVIEHENYQMGSPEYAQLMHNAARTRQIAGSTLGLHNTNSFKWYIDAINQIEETLENKAAINYAGKKRNAVNIYNADIERFVLNKVDSILATAKESKERDVALAAMFAEAKTKFSGNVSGTALTQLDLTGKKATRANKQAFIEWAKREIKRRAGVDITSEMQVELLQVSQKAQQAETELDSQDEAKAIAAAKTIREWQNKVNSYKKTDKGKVGRFFDSVFGEYAPRAMLFSPSTLLANIPGNVINGLITSSVNKVYGKNKVSQEAQKAEIHRLKQISRATGMNFATMEKPTSPSILHGEKYKQTTGAIKAIDPFTYLSETDNLFRIPIFVDTLARIATKHAEEQGVSPTELFRQYCKLHNEKGSVAQQARLEAIEIGNIAVFTQNGMLAKMANKIRDALNVVGTGNVGLGNLISPFVKTPANIVEMGARAIAFPVTGWKTLLNWNNATDKAKFDFALDGATLALSALATVLMSALQDDREWYAEPYESGKYDSNKPYDSIRFGNAWIRLDQFGTLMLPMQVGAKLVKDLQDGKAGAEIAESTGWQVFSELLRQTPVIDTFQENSMKWAATHPGQYALNYAYNQANKLIPAWGKQIARPTLRESGIVLTPESKIGKRAVRNYGLDGQDNTINDWLGIIYGRLKVEQ